MRAAMPTTTSRRRDGRATGATGRAAAVALAGLTANSSIGSAMPLSRRSTAGPEGDRQARPDERPDGVRDEDLAGCRDGTDAGRDVDRRADEAVALGDRLAGVDPDPDPDRSIGSLGRCPGRLVDDGEPAADRRPDAGEHDVEAVALGPDLAAAGRRHRIADDGPVVAQELGRGLVAAGLDERGVVAQVAEQEAPGQGRGVDRAGGARSVRRGSLLLAHAGDDTPGWLLLRRSVSVATVRAGTRVA